MRLDSVLLSAASASGYGSLMCTRKQAIAASVGSGLIPDCHQAGRFAFEDMQTVHAHWTWQ
jgi:hypothetical protein